MKYYLVCPNLKCECPLWGCQQNGKVQKCEWCWEIPGQERIVQCPKDAETEERTCSQCKAAPKKGV